MMVQFVKYFIIGMRKALIEVIVLIYNLIMCDL